MFSIHVSSHYKRAFFSLSPKNKLRFCFQLKLKPWSEKCHVSCHDFFQIKYNSPPLKSKYLKMSANKNKMMCFGRTVLLPQNH